MLLAYAEKEHEGQDKKLILPAFLTEIDQVQLTPKQVLMEIEKANEKVQVESPSDDSSDFSLRNETTSDILMERSST